MLKILSVGWINLMLFERDGFSKMTKCTVRKQVKVKTRNQIVIVTVTARVNQSSEDATTSQKSPETLYLRLI